MKGNEIVREEKFAMIARWGASGMTQKEFCANENVSMNNFQYWLKRYRKRNEEKSGKFIKLSSQENNSSSGSIFSEVVFANGNRVTFYQPIEISQLKQLAR